MGDECGGEEAGLGDPGDGGVLCSWVVVLLGVLGIGLFRGLVLV